MGRSHGGSSAPTRAAPGAVTLVSVATALLSTYKTPARGLPDPPPAPMVVGEHLSPRCHPRELRKGEGRSTRSSTGSPEKSHPHRPLTRSWVTSADRVPGEGHSPSPLLAICFLGDGAAVLQPRAVPESLQPPWLPGPSPGTWFSPAPGPLHSPGGRVLFSDSSTGYFRPRLSLLCPARPPGSTRVSGSGRTGVRGRRGWGACSGK